MRILSANGINRRHCARLVVQQGVNHDVANKMDPCLIDAFSFQIEQCIGFCGEQQVRYLIRQHPIYFLRHGSITTAQPRLNMDNRNTLFYRYQSTGNRGVHVANNQHSSGVIFIDDRLKAAHDFRSLHGMTARPHTQINIGLGDAQLVKKRVLHFGVVVLTGMNEIGIEFDANVSQRRDNRRNLHKIWSRPDNTQYGLLH